MDRPTMRIAGEPGTRVFTDALKGHEETRIWCDELRVAQDADSPPRLEGYAAVFNTLSEPMFGFRERVMPGAFKETLSKGADVRALVDHNPAFILGRTPNTLRLTEDKRGLRVSIEPPDTQLGRDTLTSVRRGDVTQMSFGFRTIEDRWHTEDGEEIRELVKVDLFDVSVVAFPAYADTSVAVRALERRRASQTQAASGDKNMEYKVKTEPKTADAADELRERIETARGEADAIRTKADHETRDLTGDEIEKVKSLLDDADALTEQLELRNRIEAAKEKDARSMGRIVPPEKPTSDPAEQRTGRAAPISNTVARDTGRCGFRNAGDFFRAVVIAGRPGGHVDPRLYELRAPTTYGSESVGTDGGFAVPPDFRTTIMEKMANSETSLMRLCDPLTTISNAITVPVDQDPSWSTSGISGTWQAEAAQLTQKKPLLNTVTINLNKYTVLVPMTDELLEDASAMNSYVPRKAAEKIEFAMNLAIVQGTGAGQPLGILKAPCLVSVAAEGSQTADTITGLNVAKMYSRMNPGSLSSAVWLLNQDTMPYIFRLGFAGLTDAGAAATGWGSQLFFPPGAFPDSPAGRILGRPIVVTQACETLGDLGDIIFADLSQYVLATKGGGIRTDISIHLYFDYDVTAFRVILRVGGQPWWGAATSPRDGSNTISPFVALAAR